VRFTSFVKSTGVGAGNVSTDAPLAVCSCNEVSVTMVAEEIARRIGHRHH